MPEIQELNPEIRRALDHVADFINDEVKPIVKRTEKEMQTLESDSFLDFCDAKGLFGMSKESTFAHELTVLHHILIEFWETIQEWNIQQQHHSDMVQKHQKTEFITETTLEMEELKRKIISLKSHIWKEVLRIKQRVADSRKEVIGFKSKLIRFMHDERKLTQLLAKLANITPERFREDPTTKNLFLGNATEISTKTFRLSAFFTALEDSYNDIIAELEELIDDLRPITADRLANGNKLVERRRLIINVIFSVEAKLKQAAKDAKAVRSLERSLESTFKSLLKILGKKDADVIERGLKEYAGAWR